MPYNYQLFINSDHSILIEFEGDTSEDLLRYILGVAESIRQSSPTGFIELVPAYNSLLVILEPLEFQPEQALSQVKTAIDQAKPVSVGSSRTIEIPVCYDARVAEDIDYVADYCGMSVEQLIEAHSSQDYTVYMLGFLPGFLYLGGLEERLHCPRRDNPRTKIEAGSVGIGGSQTGIYPIASPGGWQIIGRTPMIMLDVTKSPPAVASPLDKVRFVPISYEEFEKLSEATA
ncbi:5-oxoprolinase subunit PxpB [Kangiella koreensis]|uniref:Allophanate hydrolase subunit 1 n=1 Tax=Kangiella koreensis (strain DSM 16069 / JCM 12317 / KCTC 12182 / SW-125) TaxID=523791 RepID=C7R8W8_KANKD|nr:5-oxoprolinase subunit PxpB [Kangiella koreensis]ACV25981.1 Allophanate hydrolase subunit 1 [Kangiella koreensis DSM 16069]